MSHLKEREEKNCLNCNAQLAGTFCHICGQENVHPKESAWHLVSHFFQDITHFDGKFFSTGKFLITRPGFLPAEYARGRRATYLNPIRMYVFTSAFFFLIFFSFISPKEEINDNINKSTVAEKLKELDKQKVVIGKIIGTIGDSTESIKLNNKLKRIVADIDSLKKDTTYINRLEDFDNNFEGLSYGTEKYTGKRQYDSLQQLLPPEKKDGFFKKTMKNRLFTINEKYGKSSKKFMKALLEKFFHTLPQLLFISLPLFALLLQILYIRRKQFYYVNHLIFTLHYYIFTFISLLIIFSLSKIYEVIHWQIITISITVMWIFIYFYLYKAMRNFYGQRRAKTFFKFMALNFLFVLMLTFLFSVFFFYSLFQI